jgi:hypothetical protein
MTSYNPSFLRNAGGKAEMNTEERNSAQAHFWYPEKRSLTF